MSATFSRPKITLSRSDKTYYMSSAILALSSILAYTYPSIHMVHKVYLEQKLKYETKTLLEEQNRLRLEYEILISHAEMEKIARTAGFVEAKKEQVVYVMKKR